MKFQKINEAKNEIEKTKEIEKVVKRENLVYKENSYTYSFKNFPAKRSFAKIF